MTLRTAVTLAAAALVLATAPAVAAAQDCKTGPCHRGVGRKAVVHSPVAEGDCTDCHGESGKRHPESDGKEFSAMPVEVAVLCYECHDGVQEEVAAAVVVHEPLVKGRCLECHHPHESEHERLLLEKSFSDSSGNQPRRMPMDLSNFEVCWQCHDKYVAVMPSTTTKTGFRDGSRNLHFVHLKGDEGYLCGACHRPHSSAREKLLERPMDWTEDLVGFDRREGGGYCSPGCHGAKVYRRTGGR